MAAATGAAQKAWTPSHGTRRLTIVEERVRVVASIAQPAARSASADRDAHAHTSPIKWRFQAAGVAGRA